MTKEVFTINPYKLSVSIGGAPSGYYGNNPDLSDVKLTATYGAPQYTDTLDGLLAAGEITLTVMDGETPVTAATDVESYTITGADNSGNYDITFTSGTYQVQPRPISITVEDKTAPYGAAQKQLTYQVTTTAGGETIVNGDLDNGRLTITLSTLAGPEQDVGPYKITAVVGGTNPDNYEITNTSGTYTITAAELKAEFADPIVNTTVGGSVSNPLQLTNGSTGGAISGTLPGVTITYQSSDASVAEVDSTTGSVTVKTEGNITITANITTAETGCNYTADNLSVSYQLNVSQAGGGISVSVTPAYGLTYTGDWQDLISYTVNRPDSDLVTVTFQVRALESGDQAQLTSGGIPQGRNAGAYQVTWTASAPGYQEESGSITVEIEKASPTDGFVFSSDSAQGVTVAYNASETTQNLSGQVSLDVESLYTQEGGTYQIRSYNTAVAYVQNNNLAAVEILQTGQAEIQASFAGTDNFAAAAPSFTLTVLPADTGITAVYPYEVRITYDGEPHGSCNITAYGLTDYEVRYWSEADQDYTLTESPAITDVNDSPLEIRFQIRAFGFDEENWATGTQDIYIVAKSLQSQDITVDGIASQYTWTGSPIDGDDMRITLHDNGKLLTENVDYAVEFSNNRDVGTATVTIRGQGNYTGTVTRPFQIVSVSEQFLSAGLSEYFGYYDPVGTSTEVTVRHGSTAVTDGVTVSVTSGPSGAQVSGNTVTFHTPGIYTIHVEVSGTHTGAFDLYYTLLPQPSQDGLQLTVDGAATRIFTYGDSPTAEERTMTVQIQDAATGSWTDLKPEYYTLTYTYTGFDGTTRSGDYRIGDPLANVPEAGLYEVTAEATNGYSGTGHFVFLVLQQQLSEADFIVSGSFSYAGGAEVGPVEADISGTYWTDGGSVSLIAGDAFTLADCLNNTDAGEAQAVLQAKGNNFTGIALAEFTIAGIDLNLEGFTVETIPDQEYRGGDPGERAVTVLAPDGVTVLDPENYTVTYENNRNVGEAAAIVTGRGGYSGTIRAPFNIIPTSGQTYDLTLTVGQTAWEYDGTPHADSITVTYAGQTLTIGTDCTLTISKDGGVAVPYSTAEEAIASMVNVGTYTVTAVSKDDPALTDTVTVTVRPAASGVTVTVTPSVMNGGGTAQLQVRVTPETVDVSGGQLTVTRNGSAYGTVTLSAAGGGLYTGSFTAPNADATYVFTVVTVADAIHASATASAILTVNSSGGTGGDGGDSGDSGQTYIIEASAGVGGSISPDGRVRVSSGSDRTFRITPDDGYAIASVVVDGRGVGHMSSYTFENVQEDHTIEVTFRRATELGDPEATGVANWLNTVDHGNFLNGYSNGTFRPDANMTRAQAAQMFYNLLLDKDVPSTASYSDVAADAWCTEAVRVMSALGIVTGYADGTFRPNEPITRAQFAVIAMRFTDVTAPVGQSFSDVPSTAWYYDEVMGAAGFGWLSGYSDGTFRPNHPITRAEVAVITNRMLGRSADEAYINSHLLGIQQFTDLGLPHWAFYDIMEAANSHDYRKESGVEYWQSI